MGNQHTTSVISSTATSTGATGQVMSNNTQRYGAAFEAQVAGFARNLEEGNPLSPSLRDGVEALALAEAATIQARSN